MLRDAIAALQAPIMDGPRDLLWRVIGIGILALCVPSMGTVQRGFKSPVYRTNIEEPKNC